MEKEDFKKVLMDFLVRKLNNEIFIAETLVDDYLNNDTEVGKLLNLDSNIKP